MKIKDKNGEKYLKIPHEGKEITFQRIPLSGNYLDISEKLDRVDLKKPTSMEIASLINYIFKNQEKEDPNLVNFFNHPYYFREFTGNYCVSKSNEEINNGVFIEQNPKIIDRQILMNKKSLIKRLQNNDPLVKFVPFGFKIGKQTSKEFEKNPYAIAKYGKEGVQKLLEVASEFHIEGFKKEQLFVDMEDARLSGIEGSKERDCGQKINLFYGRGHGYVFLIIPKNK